MTFSLGAPFSFAFAAFRLRSRAVAACAAVYGAAVAGSLWLLGGVPLSWQFNLGYAMALVVVTAGTAQSFVLRSRVFPEPSAEDLQMAAAKDRIETRDRSRRLLTTDPVLAAELGIGRPDLDGRYDDGGLVDVNHVPVGILSRLPGVDEALAVRIGAVREDIGGFTSVEDLSVTLGLPPHVLDQAADHLVFVR
jgi:DNA uptake protein ComE-like DNA-binding protein